MRQPSTLGRGRWISYQIPDQIGCKVDCESGLSLHRLRDRPTVSLWIPPHWINFDGMRADGSDLACRAEEAVGVRIECVLEPPVVALLCTQLTANLVRVPAGRERGERGGGEG